MVLDQSKLTYSGDNLCLQSKLLGELITKVADTTITISSNIRHLSDVVEHMSTSEKEDGDQANSGPDIPILEDRQ